MDLGLLIDDVVEPHVNIIVFQKDTELKERLARTVVRESRMTMMRILMKKQEKSIRHVQLEHDLHRVQ